MNAGYKLFLNSFNAFKNSVFLFISSDNGSTFKVCSLSELLSNLLEAINSSSQ